MTNPASQNPVIRSWQRCRALPGGGWLFSRLLARRVPYTGTIRARVEQLAPGYAKVRMADRRVLRNHLGSIHAVALASLGELATGLAMTAAMPVESRGIPVRISIEFLKKARGEIVAEGHCKVPSASAQTEQEVQAILRDSEGDKVARFTAGWAVGPKP